MAHYNLYLILLLSFNLNWRWLLSQPIFLKIPRKADMEIWMYYLQSKAVGEIQLISSWCHSLLHLEGSHILVLELPWKLQPRIPCAQKNILANGTLYIPAVPIFLALFEPSRPSVGACTSAPGFFSSLRPLKYQQYCPRPCPAYPQASYLESCILYILEIILYYPKYYFL